MAELEVPIEAALLAVEQNAIVSVGRHALVPESLLVELAANRSPIVELVDNAVGVLDLEVDYETPAGGSGTVVTHVHVVNLTIEQRADGSLMVPLVRPHGSESVPHGLRVLRYEKR